MTESPKLNVCRPPRTRNCCWPKWAFFLNVSGNSLSGSISDLSSLRSCSSLKSLNLSRNGFIFSGSSGGFPMPLQSVDFSYNKIASQNALPWILSDCSELRVLDLKGNKISSTIPVFDCARLEHIDLPANNFSGAILPELGLQKLDLAAPEWQKHHAALITLAQIAEGCAKVMLKNLGNRYSSTQQEKRKSSSVMGSEKLRQMAMSSNPTSDSSSVVGSLTRL